MTEYKDLFMTLSSLLTIVGTMAIAIAFIYKFYKDKQIMIDTDDEKIEIDFVIKESGEKIVTLRNVKAFGQVNIAANVTTLDTVIASLEQTKNYLQKLEV